MKVNLFQASCFNGKDYKKGMIELPDDVAEDPFFSALSKAGKVFLISKIEEKKEEASAEDGEVKEEVKEEAPKKRGRKPANDTKKAEAPAEASEEDGEVKE